MTVEFATPPTAMTGDRNWAVIPDAPATVGSMAKSPLVGD